MQTNDSYREIEKAKKAQKALKSFEKKLKDQLISQANLSTKTMEDFAQLIDKAAYSTGADAYLTSEVRVQIFNQASEEAQAYQAMKKLD